MQICVCAWIYRWTKNCGKSGLGCRAWAVGRRAIGLPGRGGLLGRGPAFSKTPSLVGANHSCKILDPTNLDKVRRFEKIWTGIRRFIIETCRTHNAHWRQRGIWAQRGMDGRIYRILSITFKVPPTNDTTEHNIPPDNANWKAERLNSTGLFSLA